MWTLHGIVEIDLHYDGKGEMVRSAAIRRERFAERREWADLLQWAKDCGKSGVPNKPGSVA